MNPATETQTTITPIAAEQILRALKDITRHARLFHSHEFELLIETADEAIAKAEGGAR